MLERLRKIKDHIFVSAEKQVMGRDKCFSSGTAYIEKKNNKKTAIQASRKHKV